MLYKFCYVQSDMTLSGLWENVILTKEFYHRWYTLCLTDTSAKRGELAPLGEWYLPVWRVFVPPCALGDGPIVKWQPNITWDGGQGCPAGPHPRSGWIEFAQVVIEGWVINPYEYGLLGGPGKQCTSLPTMLKLSTLMQCPEVLLYS